jgi:NAD(P)H-flavin reductase
MNPSIRMEKQFYMCECIRRGEINRETSSLEFLWKGPRPRGGQFFLVRPERTSAFLARPLSAAGWKPASSLDPAGPDSSGGSPNAPGIVRFLVVTRGRGTEELISLRPGERAELSGPLGNTWAAFLPPEKPGRKIALVSGGVGIAPLACYAGEEACPLGETDFYAGFKNTSYGLEGIKTRSLIIATEDGSEGLEGRIPDFFSPLGYDVVFACGPLPMLKAVAASCGGANVPCFISMEQHMACGVGACLGCTVRTYGGNRRCCADGPVFSAPEVIFDA